MYVSCIHEKYPGKLKMSSNVPNHHLKYHLQLQTKERRWDRVRPDMRGYKKSLVNKGSVLIQI